jgi:nucleotide-binding universal stress UspA family protein
MSDSVKIQKIMAAVDGSPPSYNALKYAIYTASKFHAQLVVFYVVESEKVGYWQFIDEHFKKELLDKAHEVISEANRLATANGVAFESQLVEGAQPFQSIVSYVEKNPELTTLVMGDHGLGFSDRHLLGSTTERVIRLISKKGLPVAVIVVPYVEPGSPACDLFAGPLCV